MKMTIGANIKRLRTAKNITQEQLSVAMNVTCAAVSKWERGESYPDITLLQPLAYFFDVTLDELMGYDHEKIQTEIDEIIELYNKHWKEPEGREIIVKAYKDYPNDYRIMHCYMWNLGGYEADNDPSVLLEHKDEFLFICDKILDGCTDETIRLNAWNMRAKILHAEGKTDEALDIYKTKFANWYVTSGQKTEQLFAKDTEEYYYHLRKNMFELAEFAADKLGRTVFFAPDLSMDEKIERALKYVEALLRSFEETNEDLFILLAWSFICRTENDLFYRGGQDCNITAVMEKHLYASKKLTERMKENPVFYHLFDGRVPGRSDNDIFAWTLDYHLNAADDRRTELLKDPEYAKVLGKYR
ncbi:MAG: helix-turn-helix transcriptional regulator [Ruminococcaceae bacterium]|nr:helix-turn-helix transcriptional regulator [Oscillospiraceae bacterium]